jgi:hypothetical protein
MSIFKVIFNSLKINTFPIKQLAVLQLGNSYLFGRPMYSPILVHLYLASTLCPVESPRTPPTFLFSVIFEISFSLHFFCRSRPLFFVPSHLFCPIASFSWSAGRRRHGGEGFGEAATSSTGVGGVGGCSGGASCLACIGLHRSGERCYAAAGGRCNGGEVFGSSCSSSSTGEEVADSRAQKS